MYTKAEEKKAARESPNRRSQLSVGEALELIILVGFAVAAVSFVLLALAGSATAGLDALL